ncbi:MAG: sigma-70 family RNA polymerase sigma factor [Gallionella sp.]
MSQTNPVNMDDLQAQRSYLVRYAMLQLRDPHLAEDVVQETLLVAVESRDKFSGQSTLRTWLTGILKHKILDLRRKQQREGELPNTDEEQDPYENISAESFDNQGHWISPPQTWANPSLSFENQKFWEVFEMCNQRMPLNSAQAFMMREFMDMSTEEICKELAISTTNCWVLLHRARLALRDCLELQWFGRKGA